MQQHMGSSAVLEQLLHAACFLCRQDHNCGAFVSAGGIAAVLRGMGVHAGDAGVQEYGCGVFVNLTNGSPERKAAVASAGGIEAVLRAMGAHAGDVGVQELGCNALASLTFQSDERCAAVAAAGGIEAVLRGMGAHIGSGSVQRYGCGVLWNMSLRGCALAIRSAGGLAAIATARKAFPSNADLTRNADGATKAINRCK
jgi:hypothetical protein